MVVRFCHEPLAREIGQPIPTPTTLNKITFTLPLPLQKYYIPLYSTIHPCKALYTTILTTVLYIHPYIVLCTPIQH